MGNILSTQLVAPCRYIVRLTMVVALSVFYVINLEHFTISTTEDSKVHEVPYKNSVQLTLGAK